MMCLVYQLFCAPNVNVDFWVVWMKVYTSCYYDSGTNLIDTGCLFKLYLYSVYTDSILCQSLLASCNCMGQFG